MNWEYLTIEQILKEKTRRVGLMSEKYYCWEWADGKPHNLNEFGQQGWELVSVTPQASTQRHNGGPMDMQGDGYSSPTTTLTYIFKRPTR